MSDRTILIVDDDADLRGALADALADEGYRIAHAADGLEAMEYLRTNAAPDLIVLDWMMPICNGPCFRQQQSQSPSLRSIPVLVLSADMRIDEKIEEMGLDEFLVKPVALDVLLGVVERHVSPR